MIYNDGKDLKASIPPPGKLKPKSVFLYKTEAVKLESLPGPVLYILIKVSLVLPFCCARFLLFVPKLLPCSQVVFEQAPWKVASLVIHASHC